MKGIERFNTLLEPHGKLENEWVAQERPVALVFNGISHAVLMASPIDLEDFALGFSVSEGIISDGSQFYDCEVSSHAQGVELKIEISNQAMNQLKERRRFLMGPSGCGLCGVDSLASMQRTLPALKHSEAPSSAAIEEALSQLSKSQELRSATGATHCAAACDEQGRILFLREDVGRHNALDKLIGAHQRSTEEVAYYLVSSRASYEMVAKTLCAKVKSLVCVSAPTSMAIDVARQQGLNLIAFARPSRYRLYSGIDNEQ